MRILQVQFWLLLLLPAVLHAWTDPLDQWQTRASGVGLNLHDVTFGANRFVAVGQNGVILASSNGAAWSISASNVVPSLRGVAYGSNVFVAVGATGSVVTSTDAVDWTAQSSGTSNDLHAVRWLNGRFLAVGANGTILSSSNGVGWVPHDSGTSHSLESVAFGAGTFIAVGAGNSNPSSIPWSPDGVTWSNQAVSFSRLYDVAFGGGRFVALSIRGQVYISTNAHDWTHVFRTVDSRYLFRIIHVHGRFIAVGGIYGGGDQKVASSENGFDWKLHPTGVLNSATLRSVAYGNSTIVVVGDKGFILQSESTFRLRPARETGNLLSWALACDVGGSYRIEFTDEPAGGAWHELTNFIANRDLIPFVDPSTNTGSRRFYRAVSP
jgi:hypothetical protein